MEGKQNVTHRLSEYIKFKKLSVSQFESLCGLTQSRVSKAISNNSDFGYTVLENISKKFPDFNLNWLITGTGNMVQQEENGFILNEPETKYNKGDNENQVVIELQRKLIACMEENARFKESSAGAKHTTAA